MSQHFYDHTVSTKVMPTDTWKPKGYQSKWLDLAKKYNITGIIELAEQNLYIDDLMDQMWDKPEEFYNAVVAAGDKLSEPDLDNLFFYTLTGPANNIVSITFDLCIDAEDSILKNSKVNINPNTMYSIKEFVTTQYLTEAYVNFFGDGYGDEVIGFSVQNLIDNDTIEVWPEHGEGVNDLYEHYYNFFEDQILDPNNTEYTDCEIILEEE